MVVFQQLFRQSSSFYSITDIAFIVLHSKAFLRSTKENAFLILCWVSCVLQAEKLRDFLCNGSVGRS